MLTTVIQDFTNAKFQMFYTKFVIGKHRYCTSTATVSANILSTYNSIRSDSLRRQALR